MDIQVLSSDIELFNTIQSLEIFSEVKKINTINDLDSDTAVFLISDDFLSYEDLSELKVTNEQIVFYMMKNNYESNLKTVKAICDSRDFVFIPPRLTVSQIVQHIKNVIEPETTTQSNVVSFFSPISNIGTTSTCLSVAQSIQQYSKSKVGVLLLNAWDDGTDQLRYKGKYLDEIKGQLSNRLIDSDEEFLSLFHMQEKEKFYVLAGNRNVKMERLFTKEEVQYLIEMAKKAFDIVLIDCGCHFDNANIVQALKESDLRFLIVNQQYKAIKKFQYIFNDVLYPLGYNLADFLMILNGFEEKPYLPTAKDIFNEIKVPVITTINKTNNGISAEGDKRFLYDYEDDDYKESIYLLAKSITSHSGIELIIDSGKKRKRILGII